MEKIGQMEWEKETLKSKEVKSFASFHKLDLLTSAILKRRGVVDPADLKFFLSNDFTLLHKAWLLSDMERAVSRVITAAIKGERVWVFGDRDVDGISSTVLMVEALRSLRLDPFWDVPVGDDGYGLTADMFKQRAEDGVTLAIAVDCGMRDVQAVEQAQALGIDVLIFDHHEPHPDYIPPAYAVVNPKISDCYPFKDLCATAVVSKFQWALCFKCTKDAVLANETEILFLWFRGLDLVALATLADMMPLLDENRVLVNLGLRRFDWDSDISDKRKALTELLELQGLSRGRVDSVELAWRICPVINSAGRMGNADYAVRLMLSKTQMVAKPWALRLIDLHKDRKAKGIDLWDRFVPEASESFNFFEGKMSFIIDEEIPRGFTGIIAARLHENFRCLAVVISSGKGQWSGSVRSGLDITAIDWLEAMSEYFEDYGGHQQAGGFKILDKQIIPLQEKTVEWLASQKKFSRPKASLDIDAEISHSSFDSLGLDGLNLTLNRLEPYGQGFRPLTFLTKSVRVISVDFFGKPKQNHIKMVVLLGSKPWNAVLWNGVECFGDILKSGIDLDLVYTLDRDRWDGSKARRLTVLDFKVWPKESGG